MKKLNTLGVAHTFLQQYVPVGGVCFDATAGRGHDTAFLCSLVGQTGRVLAFDIQPQAVESTNLLLQQKGYQQIGKAILESHTEMDAYAQEGELDAVVFNFGYLPGGDHTVFTRAETSIQAIQKGLKLLKPHGVMSLCIYHGGDTGYEERDALLAFLQTVDAKQYTVLTCNFHNRPNDPPIPVLIFKTV